MQRGANIGPVAKGNIQVHSHTCMHTCVHTHEGSHTQALTAHSCTHLSSHIPTHRCIGAHRAHTYVHIHMCLPHPPYTHTQLQGRWPGLGSAGRAGPGPSVCSGWSPAGVGISGPRRVCRAGVHKCTSSPGLHLTDCGFLDGPGPRSSVPTCREDGMLSSEPTGLLVLQGFPA